MKNPIGDQVYPQKFQKWEKIKICDKMPSYMSHFTSGIEAIVQGTYQEICGGGTEANAQSYSLWLIKDGKVFTLVSWYKENQLTKIKSKKSDNQKLVQKYIQEHYKPNHIN